MIGRGQEEYFLAWVKLHQGIGIVFLVKILLQGLLFCDQVVLDCFHVDVS